MGHTAACRPLLSRQAHCLGRPRPRRRSRGGGAATLRIRPDGAGVLVQREGDGDVGHARPVGARARHLQQLRPRRVHHAARRRHAAPQRARGAARRLHVESRRRELELVVGEREVEDARPLHAQVRRQPPSSSTAATTVATAAATATASSSASAAHALERAHVGRHRRHRLRQRARRVRYHRHRLPLRRRVRCRCRCRRHCRCRPRSREGGNGGCGWWREAGCRAAADGASHRDDVVAAAQLDTEGIQARRESAWAGIVSTPHVSQAHGVSRGRGHGRLERPRASRGGLSSARGAPLA